VLDYNTDSRARARLAGCTPQMRIAPPNHDPVIVGLNLAPPSPTAAPRVAPLTIWRSALLLVRAELGFCGAFGRAPGKDEPR